MSARVVSLLQNRYLQGRHQRADWSQQELAQFYRVEHVLIQAGLRVETERGISDEGDPWFTFCRAEDGEVVIHFARVDGEYIIAGPAYDGIARGLHFSALIQDLISRHPLVQAKARRNTVFMHPAAMLVAVVATGFFKTSEALPDDDRSERHRPTNLPSPTSASVSIEAKHLALVITATAYLLATDSVSKDDAATDSRLSVANIDVFQLDHSDSSDLSKMTFGGQQDAPSTHTAVVADSSPELAPTAVVSADDVAQLASLVAVLTELRRAPEQTAAEKLQALALAEPPATSTQLADLVNAAHKAAATTAMSGHPTLIVDLASANGALPDVQAVRIIMNADGDGHQIKVATVSELPSLLSSYLDHGVVWHAGTGSNATGHMQNASLEANANASSLAIVDGAGMVNAHGGTPSEIDFQGMVEDAIRKFISETPEYKVIASGGKVVIYDAGVVDARAIDAHDIHASNAPVQTVTWSFSDGSSISLIGQAEHLPGWHGVAA